ncbi:hypothetical protein [Actinoplanes sp. NBRC 101535]|uniref:hypothetical protein n=1 Tax=Actinoplanes sp. NBRC 101535 TaxID=3032196 RepID=UPI002554BC81|nr:hypothetical protein [Actinoplanes sp. NBRC 101535]
MPRPHRGDTSNGGGGARAVDRTRGPAGGNRATCLVEPARTVGGDHRKLLG